MGNRRNQARNLSQDWNRIGIGIGDPFLNRNEHRFLYLDAPEGFRIVNLDHVISVKDLG